MKRIKCNNTKGKLVNFVLIKSKKKKRRRTTLERNNGMRIHVGIIKGVGPSGKQLGTA